MSWQYEIEFPIGPRKSFGEAESKDLLIHAEKEALKMNEVPFKTLGWAQTVMASVKLSAVAAIEIIKAHLTEFPTGCQVRIRCSGHIHDEILNYGPSHTHVEVVVIPVPRHR